jgi:hypothetical protein
MTTVTTTAVSMSVSTSSTKRTHLALARALLGGAAQGVAPVAVERGLLDEGLLPLGDALAHLHVSSPLAAYADGASALARS